MFFPIFPFLCDISIEIWSIEVVETQVEDSVSPICKIADRVCHYCISILLIEISFPAQCMCILNMNIESMDVFNCLYMIDYICCRANTFIYFVLALFVVVERKS